VDSIITVGSHDFYTASMGVLAFGLARVFSIIFLELRMN